MSCLLALDKVMVLLYVLQLMMWFMLLLLLMMLILILVVMDIVSLVLLKRLRGLLMLDGGYIWGLSWRLKLFHNHEHHILLLYYDLLILEQQSFHHFLVTRCPPSSPVAANLNSWIGAQHIGYLFWLDLISLGLLKRVYWHLGGELYLGSSFIYGFIWNYLNRNCKLGGLVRKRD